MLRDSAISEGPTLRGHSKFALTFVSLAQALALTAIWSFGWVADPFEGLFA
jgi:hypothetical protein